MKIGIDLDGVIFDSERTWSVYAHIYDINVLGKNSFYNNLEPKVQDRFKWSKTEEDEFFKRYVGINDFNIMPGAKEVLDLLASEGNEFVVITARGSHENSHNELDIAKERLEKENFKFSACYYGQKDKLAACQKEKVDLMIDDNYHICEALSKEGIKCIYFNSSKRKSIDGDKNIKELYDFGEIYRYIHEMGV